MTRKIIFVLVCVLGVSCNQEKKPEKPKDLIPENKFSEILYDMFVINSAKGVYKKALEEHGIFPQDYIFEKHNIDSLRFAKSNTYYAFNQETYNNILNRVKKRVEAEKKVYQEQLDAEEAAAKKRQDSIRAEAIKTRDSMKSLNTKDLKLRLDLQETN